MEQLGGFFSFFLLSTVKAIMVRTETRTLSVYMCTRRTERRETLSMCLCEYECKDINTFVFEKKKDLRRPSVGVRIITASNLKLLQARALFKCSLAETLGLMWVISSQNWTAGRHRENVRMGLEEI